MGHARGQDKHIIIIIYSAPTEIETQILFSSTNIIIMFN